MVAVRRGPRDAGVAGGEPEDDVAGFFSLNVRLLQLAGLWGEPCFSSRAAARAHRCASTVLFLLLAVAVVAELANAAASLHDLHLVTSTASVVCAHAEGVASYVYLALRPRAVPELLRRLEACAAPGHHRRRSHSRGLTAALTAALMLGGLHWALLPLAFGPERALPLPVWAPRVLLRPPWHQVTFVLLTVVNVFFELCIACLDTTYLCAALFLRGQLEVLSASLRELAGAMDSDVVASRFYYQERCSRIRSCVLHHQHILRCVRDLNENFSPVMFVRCICIVLILCLVAFEASTINAYNMKIWNLLEFLVVAMIQLYLLCWSGTELAHVQASISDMAYSTNWINMDTESRRAVCLIIHRAQRPILLTGGKFYVLSLSTFLELFKISFSYFTVLRQLSEDI